MTKILIIDDESSIRHSLRDTLEVEMYEVIEAQNGEIGVSMALDNLPDLIISDVSMPNMDGYQVLEELHSIDATATIPFVFLTGRKETDDLRHGMTLGATDYLTKPFNRRDLIQVIDTRLNMKSRVETIYNQVTKDLQNNLVSALPHEFRSPLAPIVNIAQIMQSHVDKVSVDDIQEFGDIILRATDRMSRLVENYLYISKLEILAHNPDTLHDLLLQTTSNSNEVITDAIQSYFCASDHRLDDFDMKLESASISISENYLKKAVHEIVDNACKFSDKGSPIRLGSRIVDDCFELVLHDKGRGMKPEQIKQIGAYVQFEREKYEQQGMGLGLAIVNQIIDLYQGQLSIKSKEGQGTMITIKLPLANSCSI